MKNGIALGLLTGALMACNAFDERPVTTYTPAAPPSLQPSYAGPASSSGVLAPVPVTYESGSALEVTGRLEGQLRDVQLSTDTTENYGSIETWQEGGGYLNVNVAAAGNPSGAGMLIVGLYGGANHPVFTQGTWTNADALSDDALAPDGTFVNSCAGPAVGEWPWEMAAVDYEMTAETDPEEPDAVVLVVKGRFPTDYDSSTISELTATMRFVLPE
jgi:hypothetical protein